MPYRPIDLQTSIPRAAELTPSAQYQQHRTASEQAMLAQQTVKNTERQAQRKTKAESASGGGITDRQPKGGGGRQGSKDQHPHGGAQQQETNRSEHPFKGKHIDFMG
ncbi:hypothetical protein E5161_04500 [Cohnella pontilimi]|uniref:Uncharacterized protein n=1 Tax=Cohnella pontilimi TaxID=2564100 RepID=A0A4U0FE75_9BACL|nr:hypothetical protein [Cohnella pontilimi]TJY43165.1 hypothetical protein E5161_04500 [Cohnella pontilimi]